MLRRRFGQIMIVFLGAVGLLFGLANVAHAASGVASDESSATVSIQTNDSSSTPSVNQQHVTTTAVGGAAQAATNTVDNAASTNVINKSNNNPLPENSSDKSQPADNQTK